ncbi:MAG: hypothetical protein U5N55_12350 [Cypionkella sp.]|nr:hypothetical protein [Cypionkella sp.]
MKTLFILAAATLSLSACDQYSFNREAGDMDTGSFGNATMQNTLIASGKIQPPMGHDKYDAPRAGTLLNGKYAAVVMDGYYLEGRREHPRNSVIETETNPSTN